MRNHSNKEWVLLFKASFWSGISRILILFFKLKHFSFLLGKPHLESSDEPVKNTKKTLSDIGLAIQRASRFVPWRCKCYEQAVAVKIMLNNRNIQSTMYYGVFKDENNELKAHAWVRSGNEIVTGKKGIHKFKVVGKFS